MFNIILNGRDGDNGTTPPDIPDIGPGVSGSNANCNWLDDDCAQIGGPGGPGGPGIAGGAGGEGGNGGTFVFKVGTFLGGIEIQAKGGRGGKGGNGGGGGNGGQGGKGGDGMGCEWNRHGGNGGPGGKGGDAGKGGDGGDGGSVVVEINIDASLEVLPIDVSGGDGGIPGIPGSPGQGGRPGEDGTKPEEHFLTSSDCPDMGPIPIWGAPGEEGNTAVNGKGGTAGKAQVIIAN